MGLGRRLVALEHGQDVRHRVLGGAGVAVHALEDVVHLQSVQGEVSAGFWGALPCVQDEFTTLSAEI